MCSILHVCFLIKEKCLITVWYARVHIFVCFLWQMCICIWKVLITYMLMHYSNFRICWRVIFLLLPFFTFFSTIINLFNSLQCFPVVPSTPLSLFVPICLSLAIYLFIYNSYIALYLSFNPHTESNYIYASKSTDF